MGLLSLTYFERKKYHEKIRILYDLVRLLLIYSDEENTSDLPIVLCFFF